MAVTTTIFKPSNHLVCTFYAIFLGFRGMIVSANYGYSVDETSISYEIDEPQFVGYVNNVTVVAGRDADLDCQVKNVGNYRVGWMKANDQTVLTYHKKVVTNNNRIKVTHDEHRTWTLKILQVKEEDQGCYMCQINTAIMKKQTGCVTVLVHPDIITEASSDSDVKVKEGQNITLTCKAKGQPTPIIKWKREDNQKFQIMETKRKVPSWQGEHLHLRNIGRHDMGAFLCIASNNVPPSVSKRIVLEVEFPPHVVADEVLIGCPLGQDVTLRCFVEAHPKPINYWIRGRDIPGMNVLMNSSKYRIETSQTSFRSNMSLTIRNFSLADIGSYSCISTNSMASKQETIRVYEIARPTEPPVVYEEYDFEEDDEDEGEADRRPGDTGVYEQQISFENHISKESKNSDRKRDEIRRNQKKNESRNHRIFSSQAATVTVNPVTMMIFVFLIVMHAGITKNSIYSVSC